MNKLPPTRSAAVQICALSVSKYFGSGISIVTQKIIKRISAVIAAIALFSTHTHLAYASSTVPHQAEVYDVAFSRVGCAKRELMWQDIYILSLYESENDQKAQMLRMDVVYEGDMPDGMPKDWWPELLQVTTRDIVELIDASFGQLKTNDIIQFAYMPSTDESLIFVNNAPVVNSAGGGLYQVIKGMWFGEKPISSKIKKSILGGSCAV